jgi:hypothetical protein
VAGDEMLLKTIERPADRHERFHSGNSRPADGAGDRPSTALANVIAAQNVL